LCQEKTNGIFVIECKIPGANMKPIENADDLLATEIFFTELLDVIIVENKRLQGLICVTNCS
jgi:hypothetical protein